MGQLEDIPFRVCTSIVQMNYFMLPVRKSVNYLIDSSNIPGGSQAKVFSQLGHCVIFFVPLVIPDSLKASMLK